MTDKLTEREETELEAAGLWKPEYGTDRRPWLARVIELMPFDDGNGRTGRIVWPDLKQRLQIECAPAAGQSQAQGLLTVEQVVCE